MTNKENIIAALQLHKAELLKFGVQNIGLFGSYLRNEQSQGSDIDLLIDFKPGEENFDNYMAAYDLFENIFKNEKVEIVTKNGLSKHIGPKILNEVMYV
ncbi:nucleotidyltransferase family protein [Niabella ginsengisoli]|uniref:Nucleotidyltransferase family protein n=1 Tax=Niabella ginsengisoli TaxID=522298 RepID=A0ABS9SFE7_9BACT|nr:nucleotidyltransferase family protein [Niabella ginsengisoli]MCH5596884.1 nucleotidyltransferase family protein [Niabella ginsengisoli]